MHWTTTDLFLFLEKFIEPKFKQHFADFPEIETALLEIYTTTIPEIMFDYALNKNLDSPDVSNRDTMISYRGCLSEVNSRSNPKHAIKLHFEMMLLFSSHKKGDMKIHWPTNEPLYSITLWRRCRPTLPHIVRLRLAIDAVLIWLSLLGPQGRVEVGDRMRLVLGIVRLFVQVLCVP